MMEIGEITNEIIREIRDIQDDPGLEVSAETALVGEHALLKSRDLVTLLLALEEFAENSLNAAFDWTSDSAMSSRRSIFRTVGSLAAHLQSLQK